MFIQVCACLFVGFLGCIGVCLCSLRCIVCVWVYICMLRFEDVFRCVGCIGVSRCSQVGMCVHMCV